METEVLRGNQRIQVTYLFRQQQEKYMVCSCGALFITELFLSL